MNRKKLSIIVALAFCMTILNTVGAYATTTSDTNTSEEENTLNLSEIEALKSANQKEIEEIQNQLDDTKQKLEQSQNDTTLKEEYQQQLQDKMTLQQENIQYIETQLSQIQDDISTLNKNIDYLESEMNSLELNIDTNMQQFKKRLKAMYVSGDDSIASILVGTTDFFEMLSKMEFISRISSHDNALMETLQSQIDDYNEDKEILTQSLKELEDKKQEATSKKSEFNETLSSLSSDYENTQSEIDRLSLEQEALNGNIEDLEQYQKEQEEEEKQIQKALEDYYIQSSIAVSRSVSASESESVSKSVSESQSISESVSASISESQSVSQSIKDYKDYIATSTTKAPVISTQPVTVDTTITTTQNPYSDYITSGYFNWPVPNFYTITDYYGTRTWNSQGMHYGMDISGVNVNGANIVSAESGTVVLVKNSCTHNYGKNASCGCGGGFGNYVIIDHGNGYSTLYGHCADVTVSIGETIQRGQVIGHVGSTGYSTGYHLHFEVRYNGNRIDPLPYLSY